MRRTRRFILLLIAFIIAGVAVTWKVQKRLQAERAPSKPASLPESISARADDWEWEDVRNGKTAVRVRAKDYKQNTSDGTIELIDVELKLFNEDSGTYDHVRSAKADFNRSKGVLFSEGAVEITMGLPADASKRLAGKPVTIKTSGATFESKTGKTWTDRQAYFHFENGEGWCTGALYDPQARELRMYRDVKLVWSGDSPDKKPMEVESGSLVYKEAESKVLLLDWSKFTRDTLTMNGGPAVVTLKEGLIETVDAQTARGVDVRPAQKTEYAADNLTIRFDPEGVLQSVTGDRNASLVSTTATTRTDVSAPRIDLAFEAQGDDALLSKSRATGGAVVKSAPVPRDGVPTPDTRVMRSDTLALYMRPNGEEIDRVDSETPGTIEFHPNRPGQRQRTVNGNLMKMQYAENNRIRSFQAVDVSTRTESLPVKGKPQPPALTWSKAMNAEFDPKTGAMDKIEQWGDFRYEEGERKATSERAEMRGASEEITLTGTARVWDNSGSTSADTILLRQKTGEFEANGRVASMRLPEQKQDKKNTPGMLSGSEPLQAKAQKMSSRDDNSVIEYAGNALMWQGPNRVQADRIRIDRKNARLQAWGKVETQLLESVTKAEKADQRKAERMFTVVRAPELNYDDKQRLAHYTGGAALDRGAMDVTAREIRAFLKQGETDSSLDRAFADGDVKILQVSPERTRTGTAQHAEYYADAGKIILRGGQPQFVDTLKGTTRGEQITYYANDDRFTVEGEESKPVESRLPRKAD
jgi:lipopolysaccharide export system protein LptA